MENFDQLIKNIAESKQPAFKEQYWTSFAKQAGFKVALSGAKIALISAGSVAVTAGGVWLGVHIYNNTASTENANPPETVQPAPDDTLSIPVDTLVITPEVIETLPVVETPTKAKPTAVKVVDDAIQSESKPAKEEEIKIDTPKYRWRVLTIDVDTIKGIE